MSYWFLMNAQFKNLFPVYTWLPGYRISFLKWDLIAGTTLAFFAIPTSMAYATLAGLPPQTGIYCYLFAGLLYFVFGTSRHLAVGPTSAISIIVATSIGALAGNDPAKAITLASATALLMAGLFLGAYIIRLSSLINFISDTVLTGFKAGAALVIASTQLPKLFGIPDAGDNFIDRIRNLITNLGETNITVLVFGMIALILLLLGNHYLKGKPVSLIIVIISILLVSFAGFKEFGITVVGEIPKGIPALRWSVPNSHEFNDIFFLALACFFLSYIESISAARSIAREKGYEIDPQQELLALGAANLASSLGGGYAVAGGLSQSTVNARSGAKSLISLIITSVILAVSLYFLTGLFKNLPHVILAVIVIDALISLVNLKELKHLFRVSRLEFWVSALTIVAVVLFGVLKGILIAVILSIISVLRKSASPHMAVLGRIPGTTLFSDMLRHPDNQPVDGVLILRPESSLLYFNVNFIRDSIKQALSNYPGKPYLVILDLSSANFVDVAGARFLLWLEDDLEKKGIGFRIVDALGNVRDTLRKAGMEKEIGHISRKHTINEILAEYNGKPVTEEESF
ncbi:MAG TPA: sulfate permease [Bacteroidales bacterium]|nr:sulfate permease [Bacteroidales bacterium]HPM93519.1 sulfate permease [Bacteroidales bacterium]